MVVRPAWHRARGFLRLHRKVLLVWCSWCAVQLVLMPEEVSIGAHIEPLRPLVDLFIGPLTIALGRHPVLTDPRTAQRHTCRGFLLWDERVF